MNKFKWMAKYKALLLAIIGLTLIFIAIALNREMSLPELFVTGIANLGALILGVVVLQWLFDQQMREEMIREISHTVLGNTHIYEKGIVDCSDDSSEVKKEDLEQWIKAETLIVGAHYAEHFFLKYLNSLFQERCKAEKETIVLLSKHNGHGIEYLKKIDKEVPNVEERVQRIIDKLNESTLGNQNTIKISLHSIVLHYLFIATEQAIWIIPMLNSKGTSKVSMLKIRHDSPLYEIYYADIQRLIEQSEKVNNLT